jgi:hypothetical protein
MPLQDGRLLLGREVSSRSLLCSSRAPSDLDSTRPVRVTFRRNRNRCSAGAFVEAVAGFGGTVLALSLDPAKQDTLNRWNF